MPTEMNQVERTAALALAVLSRQPGAQSTLASLDGFFAVVAKLLASPDVQVAQHGAATLGGLFTSSDEDAFTRGFVAAQVLQSNVLGPLMALAQAPVLPEPTRGWLSLCITNLASHPSSRQALTQFGIDRCADACVRLLGGGKTPTPPSMVHRMMRVKSSSSPMSPSELKLVSIAEAGVVDEAKLSAALLQILKLRPNVPGETFARPGSLEAVLALADSEDAAVVRNAAGMLVLMCRSPGLWAQSLPVLVRLVEHTDGDVRLAATRAIADVCNSAEMPMRVAALLTDVASKLPKAPGVPPSVVCRALEGLAAVVFSPNWEPRTSFFGFGPKQAVLPFLLQAAQRAGDDPLAAMEAMHALTLACKAKGALSAHYRVETVRCALAAAAAVLARGTTDAALRHASEGLLASAVGFSVGDLQLVANDAELLGEWARLALDVKLCVLVDYCVFRLAAHAWPHMADSSTLPPFPFYDARVDIAQLDALGRKDSARAASMKRWTVKAALSEVASAPPAELFKSFTSALGTELFERLSHEFSQVAESPKKEFAVKAFTAVASTLSRAATPTTPPLDASFTPEPAEPRDWYDIILSVCNFTPHRFGTRGWDALPSLVTELLHEQSPGSTLARALATQPSMFQELEGGGGGPHGLLMHPRARSLVLGDVKHNVPLQVLPRLVADAPSAVLKDFPGVRVKSDGACQLVLRDCRLLGDARARLVDALFRAPAVTQLVFSSAVRLKDDEEEELVGLVADLPPTVTSLVFDRTLSPTGLRLVMVFLSQRKHVPLLLALTNLGLSGEDMEPVLRYTSRLNPSSRTFGTLRHLDLGGNALSDASVAALIRGIAAKDDCSLAALHVNDNALSLGTLTVDALLGSTTVSAGKQAKGESKIRADGLLAKSLRRLSLARAHLPNEAACRLLYALSKKMDGSERHSQLVMLDLDGNYLRSLETPRALMSVVAFNPNLKEIGFAGNDLGEVGIIQKACELNTTLQILRCDLSDEEAVPLEAALARNRAAWRFKDELGPASGEHDAKGNHHHHHAVAAHDLFVLFSAPLCWRDGDSKLLPLDRLDHEAEKELLLQSLAEAHVAVGSAPGIHFDFGTSDSLMSALTRRPAALHWSGHGTPDYVAFEDGKGGMHAVSTEQLASICASARHDDLKLVVVSACSSRAVAEAFVNAGVKSVVAIEMGMQVLDRAARVFSRAFYLAILMGDPVRMAFNIGREAVKASPSVIDGEANKFVLLGTGDEVVFPRRRVTLTPRGGVSMPFPSLDKWRGLAAVGGSDQPIVGRAVDVYLVIGALLSRRLVSVTGPEGVGKSQLCAAAAKYLNDRRIFEDGVVFVDCSRARTQADVVDACYRLVFGDAPVPWRSPMDSILAELVTRRAVLVFDHVDSIDQDDFRLLLGGLLDRTKGLRILVIVHSKPGFNVSASSIPGHDELTHVLGSLMPLDAAKLFLRCSPLYHADSTARPLVFVNFEAGLARHPTLVRLKGVPRDVARAAAVQTEQDWRMLVEEVVEGCLPPLSSQSSDNVVYKG